MSKPNSFTDANLIASLPHLPNVAGKPVFVEPWETRIFALAITLSEQGYFTWNEWIVALSDELNAATGRGESNDPAYYYRRWLAALDHLVIAKGLVDAPELLERRATLAETFQRTT